ncbi:telomeric repeat binding factor a isoform X2 [Cebidichthys violaceus]|uniref:telomeric repeat binding factor a isoform X2 n=1 Tax=Cebidichthys violaceus TaxID=271503 RepID=UPI0035CAEB5A
MAAKETVVSNRAEVEATVNRWIVDYYSFLSLELFKNEKYEEFCAIRDLIHSVLTRPLESSDVMQTKIRVLQFLSRINDGEHLDLLFESDESLTPLESALMVLENITQEYSTSLPQQDFERVSTSLKEMMVGMFIKNKQFDKAKEVVNKHFPKSMVGKKAIFMGLIKKKSNVHEAIEQIDFQQFKKEMLAFCQSLCPFNVPFLHKAATQLLNKRLTEQDVNAAGPDEQDEAVPSSSPPTNTIQFAPCTLTIIQRTRLEVAYKALAASSGERIFAQLEEEVEEEEQARKEAFSRRLSPALREGTILDSEQDGLFQRDSGSPMEASPADQLPQTDAVSQTESGWLSKTSPVLRNAHPNTVARLVMEPDSQGSSQCTTASQEQDVRTEEPPQPPAIPDTDSQSLEADTEVSKPMRKIPRRANKICSRVPEAVCITDSTLDSSPELSPVPRTSSTPNKDSAPDQAPSHSKWKHLYNTAKESKETWSDEESCFSSRKNTGVHNESTISNSGHRKRKWSESETNKLKEGVQKFGEGNWTTIKAYYSFNDRTNVNLKDRWRTMKKLNMI